MIYEAYFEIAVETLLNLQGMVWVTNGDYLNNSFMIFYAFVAVLFPWSILIFLQYNFSQAEDKKFLEKFEAIYENVRPDSRIALLHGFHQILRRLLFAATAVFVSYNPGF